MKYFFLLAAVFFCGTGLFAADKTPAQKFDWSLLWSGSWEENRTLHNRGEIKLNFLPPGLILRGQVLDRRTMNFELEPPWGNPAKGVTNFTGGLYHKPTGSRLLYGVLDEWGLSARLRNPWIRSAPYAENHKPLMADMKTAASSSKEDEAYLYLSSPFMTVFDNVKLRGFASAQTSIEAFTPALSGGLDVVINKNTGILLETFYTGAVLPPVKSSSWFSYPPVLPEREFNLYAAGFLFTNPLIAVSADWALSETFAWGSDFYGNLGVCVTPSVSIGNKSRPLSFSFAADGAGERFIYRDGANHGEGFRTAGKIELKGIRNSLLRLNTVLRRTGSSKAGFGEHFNRSTTGIYYRFPAQTAGSKGANSQYLPVRMTRVSLTASRNADNLQKINDGISGYFGFSINPPKSAKSRTLGLYPLGVNFSGSVKSITSSEDTVSPYPFFGAGWVFDSADASCELTWSPQFRSPPKYQFKAKFGYTAYAGKDDQIDFSLGAAVRFKRGRVSLKASSSDFPEKWSSTVTFRLEK